LKSPELKVNDLKPAQPLIYAHPDQDTDETSLIDLWLVLTRHKEWIFGFTLLGLVGGGLFAYSQTTKYTYTSTIKLGNTYKDGTGMQPIESPDTSLAKLEQAYIPQASGESGKTTGIKISIPKGSQLIVLESTGSEKMKDEITQLHIKAANLLINDHNTAYLAHKASLESEIARFKLAFNIASDKNNLETLRSEARQKLESTQLELKTLNDPTSQEIPRKELANNIIAAENKLAGLSNEENVLRSNQRQLITESELLTTEISRLQNSIDNSSRQISRAAQGADNEGKTVSLLLIDNSIQQQQTRLSDLQNRLRITIPDRQATLAKELEDNLRFQKAQFESISLLKTKASKLLDDQKREITRKSIEIRPIELELASIANKYSLDVAENQTKIEELSRQLDLIQNTSLLSNGLAVNTKSASPITYSVLGTIMGAILGLFAVMMISFLGKVKQAQSSSSFKDHLPHG
jgi:hypothetical protein